MYVLLLNNCKIDIFFGVSLLSYQTIHVIITTLQRMFAGNANKYNYDYNYYHNSRKNTNRYLLNEEQDMNDDYGFFVILDQDPFIPQFRSMNVKSKMINNSNNRRDTTRIYDSYTKTGNRNGNSDSIESGCNSTKGCRDIINRHLYYDTILNTFSVSPIINIYGIVYNVVKWLFSE